MQPDLLIHDDMCTFKRRAIAEPEFKGVVHWTDRFHMPNHKCPMRKYTAKQWKRCEGVLVGLG